MRSQPRRTRKDGHADMSECLLAGLGGVEVLGVRANLDAVEDRGPASGDVERRDLLDRVDRMDLNAGRVVAQEMECVDSKE